MDDRALFAHLMVNFLGLRASDPAVIQMLVFLAGPQGSQSTHYLTRAVDETLRNLAADIGKKTKPITDFHKSWFKGAKLYAALKDNAFNWKTGQFQAPPGLNVGSRLVNRLKLNPMLKGAKSDALNGIFSTALTHAGLPSAAVQPTANMLAGIILGDAKA